MNNKYPYYPKKDDIAAYFENYANTFELPVAANTKVLSVIKSDSGYLIKTSNDEVFAKQIIIATGPYNQANIPEFAKNLSKSVYQIHSSQYKNSNQIASNSVAVVGGGNSATQLAEELFAAGKEVTLVSTKMPWFLPKTIFGISSYWWFYLSGILHAGAETWISKYVRKRSDGIIGTNALKLIKNGSIKHVISRVTGSTPDTLVLENGKNISVESVIWATGFAPSYKWIKVDGALDEKGQPLQDKGISPVDGLYWIGLPWQTKINSGIINGVGHDARRVIEHIKMKSPAPLKLP